jgi:hypothetical protein
VRQLTGGGEATSLGLGCGSSSAGFSPTTGGHRADQRTVTSCAPFPIAREATNMITLGIILLIVGFLAHIPLLWGIGILLLILGLIFAVLGALGRAVFGRRHFF